MALCGALLLVGAAFGVRLLFIPRTGHGVWEGAAVALVLGAATAFSLWEAAGPGIVLKIDAEGIRYRQAFGKRVFEIPWPELVRVRAANVYGQPSVLFDAVDPNWGLAEAKPFVRRMRQASLDAFGSWMAVPTRLLGVDPERVVEDVERLGRLYAARASAFERPRSEAPARLQFAWAKARIWRRSSPKATPFERSMDSRAAGA